MRGGDWSRFCTADFHPLDDLRHAIDLSFLVTLKGVFRC
jgi:hypothetical protein